MLVSELVFPCLPTERFPALIGPRLYKLPRMWMLAFRYVAKRLHFQSCD